MKKKGLRFFEGETTLSVVDAETEEQLFYLIRYRNDDVVEVPNELYPRIEYLKKWGYVEVFP